MIENQLLNAILASRDTGAFSKLALDRPTAWKTHREAYQYVQSHLTQYGELPSATSVLDNTDNFELIEAIESPATLASKLHERNLKGAERQFIETVARDWDRYTAYDLLDKFEAAIADFRTQSNTTTGGGIDWARSGASRLGEYERRKTAVITKQCPFLFDELTQAIGMANAGAYITFMGFTKRGKTWFGLLQALRAHEAGLKVLFESGEMSKEEIQFRLDTLATGFSNRELLAGNLDYRNEEAYKTWLLTRQEEAPFIIKTDEDWNTGGLTLEQIQRDIETVRPDVVIIDQFSLIQHKTPDRAGMSHTSRQLKRLARKTGIVLVNLYQTDGAYVRNKNAGTKNEEGVRVLEPPSASNYSETIAVIQDSDALITFDTVQWYDEASKTKYGKGLMRVELSRNGGEGLELELNWIPDIGAISPKRPMDVF